MMRRTWSLVAASAIVAIALPKVIDLPKILLWNPSPSAPIGLYHVRPADNLQVADLVVVDLPEPLARFVVNQHAILTPYRHPILTPVLRRILV
jgi:type IV secretory pathway protease TraF